ncbi:ATP-binding protein [Alkaliphilus metalliredigens]|nr:4Fe-4S binding protein [Alkaliphilus metalliredigens]
MKYLMQKLIIENYSSIDKKRCLYQRNQAEPCRICQDHCPSEAISLTKSCVEIDEEVCKGCGICKSTCPSQAITLKEFGEEKNLQNLNPNEVVLIGCKQETSEGNILFPCLNGLHKEYLVILMLLMKGKRIYFNVSQCENCYIEKGCHYFIQALTKAETVINGLGMDANISLIYHKEDLPSYTTQVMSRRELFTLFKDGSVHMTLDATSSILGKNNVKDFRTRNLLVDMLKEENDLNKEAPHHFESLFTTWSLDSKCNGCGLCEAVCPWKAWQIERSDEVNISHHARRCRSCTLCHELCPQKAINKDAFSLNLLAGAAVKTTIPLVKCHNCNKKYVQKTSEQQLCNTCSKRKKLKKSVI